MLEPKSDIDTHLKKHVPCDGSGFSGNPLADDKSAKLAAETEG